MDESNLSQYNPHCIAWTQDGDSFHLVAGDIINELPIEIICTTITVPCRVQTTLAVHGNNVDNQSYDEGTYIVPLAIKTLGPHDHSFVGHTTIKLDIFKDDDLCDDLCTLSPIQINTYWVYQSKDYIARSHMLSSVSAFEKSEYYRTPFICTQDHGSSTRIYPSGGPVSGITITARNMQRCRLFLQPYRYSVRNGKLLIGDSAMCSDINIHTQSVHFPIHSPIQCCDLEYFIIEPIPHSGESTILTVSTHHIDYMMSECTQTKLKCGIAGTEFS